MVVIWKK